VPESLEVQSGTIEDEWSRGNGRLVDDNSCSKMVSLECWFWTFCVCCRFLLSFPHSALSTPLLACFTPSFDSSWFAHGDRSGYGQG
jgi:hypothetical protein